MRRRVKGWLTVNAIYLQLRFLNDKLNIVILNLYSDLQRNAEYSLEKCSKFQSIQSKSENGKVVRNVENPYYDWCYGQFSM